MFDDPDATFTVVINHEEQYSIWPQAMPVPPGWTEVGFQGAKQECLARIEELWTDMRPLSLRRQLAEERA
ncbi:MbtH family protein [Actinomadura welshii]